VRRKKAEKSPGIQTCGVDLCPINIIFVEA